MTSEPDRDREQAAFPRARAVEGRSLWERMYGPRERDRQTIAELERVKKALAKCSARTLELLDYHITEIGVMKHHEPKHGLVMYHVEELIDVNWQPPHEGGKPRHEGYRAAIAVLSELYDGEKVRGSKENQTKEAGTYRFSDYVEWLGPHLRRLDPDRLRSDDAACVAAHSALAPVDDRTQS